MHDQQPATTQKQRRPRRTPEQELAYLAARMAKVKSAAQQRSRKAETREKIVIGGAIVRAMRSNPDWQQRVVALLKSEVTRPVDREAIAPWLSAT